MAEDLGEKTEDATPRRKQQARERGQVAKSMDFGAAVMLLVAVATIALTTMTMLERGGRMLVTALDAGIGGTPIDVGSMPMFISILGREALVAIGPLLAVMFLAGAISQILQVGLLLSFKVLEPNLNKLSPISGAKRIFGLNAVMKAMLDALKLVVVLAVAALTIHQYEERIAVLPFDELGPAVVAIARMLLDFTLRLILVLLLIGLLDLWYQRWKQAKDMRMSKQEVKDELKQTQGDPKVKQRRFAVQQQIAMQRINSSVPQADVVVTNPEHYAIAIRYDEARMAAPTVVAKGVDFMAMRIRQVATQHGVPIVERPPLARALYRDVEVGQSIPPDLYAAVAEVLAYVYRLAGREPAGAPA